MKNSVKRATAVIMALAMVLAFSACGGGVSASDATALVKGNLEEIYLGVYDPTYLRLVNITEAEAEEVYLSGLEYEAKYFMNYFQIEHPKDEYYDKVVDLYKQIYAKSRFTVGEATKIDDSTFSVEVKVEPLNIFQLAKESLDSHMAAFHAKYTAEEVGNMTDEEYEAYDEDWANSILDMLLKKLPEMGYMPEETITMHVTLGSDNFWTISDDDMGSFDTLVIYYPSFGE